jgi:hypothetical protein
VVYGAVAPRRLSALGQMVNNSVAVEGRKRRHSLAPHSGDQTHNGETRGQQERVAIATWLYVIDWSAKISATKRAAAHHRIVSLRIPRRTERAPGKKFAHGHSNPPRPPG